MQDGHEMPTEFLSSKGGGDCSLTVFVFSLRCDHLGTPQAITDENGSVVWKADYKPFGEVTLTTSAVENDFRFPGQYFDAETGLHYNWHRYYDAGTGRYFRSDPTGLEDGMNLYPYAHGNPLINTDFKGLACGSGITEYLVPDKFFGFNFTIACIYHDKCYDTCPNKSGAGNFNDSLCFNKGAYYTGNWYRSECDKKFFEEMKKLCSIHYKGKYDACINVANLYYKAVMIKGEGPFLEAQADRGCCGAKELKETFDRKANPYPSIDIPF